MSGGLRHPLLRPLRRAGLALEILVAYVRARRLVGRRDLPSTLRALRTAPVRRGPAVGAAEAAWLGRAVTRTLAPLPDAKCLARSLVLTALLARRGTASRFVLGVRPGASFVAHAWVEVDGLPVLPVQGFDRLTEL